MKKTIKLTLEESDIELLERQAEQQGVSRAELIRSRVLTGPFGRQFTPKDLSTLVSRVNRVSNLPRSEVERLVYTVFTALMSESRAATTPGL